MENYKDGKLDGKWNEWYENGQKKKEEYYKDGISQIDKHNSWYENGQKKREIDNKTGKVTEWYKDGHIKYETHYKDGKRHGKRTFWYGHNQIILGDKKFPDHAGESGKKRHEKNYKDGNLVTATYYSYHLDGQNKTVENYKDGKLDGKWNEWYENGQKKKEEYYKDGISQIDKHNSWYENGQKKREIDNKTGKVTEWYKDGHIKYETHYKDGKRHGKRTFWYGHNQIILGDKKFPDHAGESGKKRHEKNYKDGNLVTATYYSYHLDGQNKTVENYKDGKLDGKWNEWYENGQKKKEEYYKDGISQIDKHNSWYENGQKKREIDNKTGKVTEWYKDGHIKYETHYKRR